MHHSFCQIRKPVREDNCTLDVNKRWVALFVIATIVNHFVPISGLFCSGHFLTSLGALFEIAEHLWTQKILSCLSELAA